LVTGLRFVQVVQQQPKTEAENFPKAAVDWLQTHTPAGEIFNSYNWGGYLIWRLYPQYRVFIDGRADVYGDAFIFNYMSIYDAKPGWQAKLNDQGIQPFWLKPTPLWQTHSASRLVGMFPLQTSPALFL